MEDVSLAGLTLHVADLETSLEFYRHLPGAKVVVHRPGEFAMLRIGYGRLGLLQTAGADEPNAGFHIELEAPDLAAIYEDLRNLDIEPESPPQERPWGDVNFRIVDPDGNVVQLNAAHEPARSGQRR